MTVRESKNGSTRTIPLNAEANSAIIEATSIRHVMTNSPFLFCTEQGKAYKTIREGFKGALKRAGLDGRGFTFHSLRHTFASSLASRGVSIRIIADLLGHRTIQMTMRYAHVSPDGRRSAVEVLDEIPAEKGTEKALGDNRERR